MISVLSSTQPVRWSIGQKAKRFVRWSRLQNWKPGLSDYADWKLALGKCSWKECTNPKHPFVDAPKALHDCSVSTPSSCLSSWQKINLHTMSQELEYVEVIDKRRSDVREEFQNLFQESSERWVFHGLHGMCSLMGFFCFSQRPSGCKTLLHRLAVFHGSKRWLSATAWRKMPEFSHQQWLQRKKFIEIALDRKLFQLFVCW